MVVPKKVEEWLQESEASLCLQHCGYWLSLAGDVVTENQDNITVSIPRKNMFTAEALEIIMQKILQGERL